MCVLALQCSTEQNRDHFCSRLSFFRASSTNHAAAFWLRQFETVGMVPKSYFDEQRSIYCYVERVIDGDTVRVRHLPAYPWRVWIHRRQRPLPRRGIAGETLSIRVYGVDCPELAKRRAQRSQPHAEAAKEFTAEFCLHRTVKITLLRKDQYGRAVAAVERLPPAGPLLKWVPGLGRKDLSVALAREGLAELYTGGGAEYWVSAMILGNGRRVEKPARHSGEPVFLLKSVLFVLF